MKRRRKEMGKRSRGRGERKGDEGKVDGKGGREMTNGDGDLLRP